MPLPTPRATLHDATHEDLPCIENMMQFYNYDLSEGCAVEFAPHGLYALRSKTAYWSKPGVKPFIVRVDDELAGFAVVDDELIEPTSRFNMGYFFLARRYRGRGLAVEVAAEIFTRFPGQWEIYHFTNNLPAARFWPKAISCAGCVNLVVRDVVVEGETSILYRFSTSAE